MGHCGFSPGRHYTVSVLGFHQDSPAAKRMGRKKDPDRLLRDPGLAFAMTSERLSGTGFVIAEETWNCGAYAPVNRLPCTRESPKANAEA